MAQTTCLRMPLLNSHLRQSHSSSPLRKTVFQIMSDGGRKNSVVFDLCFLVAQQPKGTRRSKWVWVKIKRPGDRRFWSLVPSTRAPTAKYQGLPSQETKPRTPRCQGRQRRRRRPAGRRRAEGARLWSGCTPRSRFSFPPLGMDSTPK